MIYTVRIVIKECVSKCKYGKRHCPGPGKVNEMERLMGLAEGARFETPTAPETIGPDIAVSVPSQSFTKASGR